MLLLRGGSHVIRRCQSGGKWCHLSARRWCGGEGWRVKEGRKGDGKKERERGEGKEREGRQWRERKRRKGEGNEERK